MIHRAFALVCCAGSSLLFWGCVGAPIEPDPPAGDACDADAAPTRTVACIEAFTPGKGYGFGADKLPGVLYGEPKGGGVKTGSLDVLSLGAGGEIVVGFGGNSIVDGPGPDFIVFENAFYVGGDPSVPYKELADVSVSGDGATFVSFPCSADAYPYDGCAGWHAVLAGPGTGISPFDPESAGGDSFDLAEVGVASARFVRIRDRSTSGAPPSAGFDLDAVVVVNAALP